MSIVIPRPARDIIMGPISILSTKENLSRHKAGSVEMAIVGIYGGGIITLPPAEKMIKAICRTALAIFGALALLKIGGSMAVGATVGAFISLPAVAIAGGSFLAYQGIAGIAAAVTSGCFATLGIGAASLLGGWLVLEGHDIIPFGIGEMGINAAANSLAPSFVRSIV